MSEIKGFHWADYVVFASTLAFSFVVGIYQRFIGDRQRSTKEYLLGNRLEQLYYISDLLFLTMNIDFYYCINDHVRFYHRLKGTILVKSAKFIFAYLFGR